MLEKDFYTKVEKPGYLKRVLYSDSVAENCETLIKRKTDSHIHSITFKNLWDELVKNGEKVIKQNNKEYIYLQHNKELLTATYNIKNDELLLREIGYIVRHYVEDELIDLKLTNLTSLPVTKNHSLLGYKKENDQKQFVKITPDECTHVPILNNQINFNINIDINYLIFGSYIGDNRTLLNEKEKYDSFIIDNYEFNRLINSYDTENNILYESTLGELYNDYNKLLNFLCGYYLSNGSFNGENIILTSKNYIILNQIRKLLISIGCYSHISSDQDETIYHLEIFSDNRSIIDIINIINLFEKPLLIKPNGIFYKSDGVTTNTNKADLLNVQACSVKSFEPIQYNGYVYDFNVPYTQIFVANGCLVHNTDSIFIQIPEENAENKEAKDLWNKAENAAESINDLIIDYNKNVLLPRCNIDPEKNETFFKTELLMTSMLFLDVKKNYAYKLLVKEGVVLNEPKISYTGIQVIKSDSSKFTQDLLREIIENIMLNEKIKDDEKTNKISKIVDQFNKKFKEDVDNFDFTDIGIPGKWSKKILIINGMKMYNKIMNTDTFSMGSAGKFIYCKFASDPGPNINGVCVPYEYDKELLKEKFIANKIVVDENKQWNTLITTTCKRVFDLAKKLKSK